MKPEIEATFIEIDHDGLRQKLKTLGAKCEQPKYSVRRKTFDYPDLRLDSQAAWIRVRQEADKTTMGYKQRKSETVDGMYEVEFAIDSFDNACKFLEAIGLRVKASQDTTREVWKLDNCEIMLDEWPWIPPYAEVEGPDEQSVKLVSEKLGFDYSEAMFDSADAVYMKYFDVTRTEITTVPLVFGPVPDWLEKKRRA